MVSQLELGSDPPIGSDRESGCDRKSSMSSSWTSISRHLHDMQKLENS